MSRSLFLINPSIIRQNELIGAIQKAAKENDLQFSSLAFPRVDVYKEGDDLLEIYLATESEFLSTQRTETFKKGHGHLFMIAINDRRDDTNNKILIAFLKSFLAQFPSAIVYNEEAYGSEHVRMFDKADIDKLSADMDYYDAFYKD